LHLLDVELDDHRHVHQEPTHSASIDEGSSTVPLPSGDQPWPPTAVAPITAKQAEWDAWYVGDTGGLERTYAGRDKAPVDRVAQYRGGAQGALARMWWGRPVGDLRSRTRDDRTHVPLAADMCQASADLLYAEPPTLTAKGKPAQAAIDDALEHGLITRLAEGAEIGAALGDHYLRVTWDDQIADRSFITAVHADAAIPEFRWGILVAVTFWWVVNDDGTVVRRHLERHELAGNGTAAEGVIFHGLYEGTRDKLGRPVPLVEDDSTKGIRVDDQSMIRTESPGLAVVHVPNQTPQRLWRNVPAGRHLGRSDLAGVESHMDKLDMVYTSWMRDVRLAKSRLIVPSYMLEHVGAGRGAFFDDDQDVYVPVAAPPREDGKSEITAQQFAIRVADHEATAQRLVNDILRTAGYSQQTFGEGDDGAAITATEVTAKDRRSARTRDRKIRNTKPALQRLLRKKLDVDAVVFRSGTRDVDVEVTFADADQVDPLVMAQTLQALFTAQSASIETRVRMMHPDWDEPKVKAEVGRIQDESSVSVPDPGSFRPGVDDEGGGDDQGETDGATGGDGPPSVVGSGDAGQS
jgi:hypothetical protein